MKKIKFVLVYSMELLLIFCCTTGTAFGINSNDTKSVQSGDYLNSEVSNVNFDYYNYFFGLNSLGNTVITRYGKLPVLKTEEQRESWNSTLGKISDRIKDTVASKYMYPRGQVVTCGANAEGYFVILFKYDNVSESLMSEIYALIDNSAKEMGIQEIPVEFGYGTYRMEIPLNLEQGTSFWFGESTENLSESDIHTIQGVMKEKPTEPVQKIIAAYGKIPLLKNQNEILTWADKLSAIASSTQDKINPYMKRGQVIVYGGELTRLEVGINETVSSEEKTTIIKKIYHIIDEEARKQNITNVPVYFDEGIFINDIATGDIGVAEDTSNSSISEEKNTGELNNLSKNDLKPFSENNSKINNSNGDKSSRNNFIPGFELLGGLVCLYGGWRFKRK
jgi:hypothetical protein